MIFEFNPKYCDKLADCADYITVNFYVHSALQRLHVKINVIQFYIILNHIIY